MERAVVQGGAHVDERIAGEDAVVHLLFEPLGDGRDVFAGHDAADDFVHELEVRRVLFAVGGFEQHPDVAVLAASAGLPDVLRLLIDALADGLAVGDLRLADVGFDAELAAHAFDEDVQVQLAHAGDDGLAGFFVGGDGERRILLRQLAEGGGHLLLVGDGLRLHGDGDHRIGEVHPLQGDAVVRVADGVAGGGVLQADGGGDVAGAHFLDFVAAVGVHLHHAPDALAPFAGGVVDLIAGVQHAGIDAEEGQRADVGIGGDLEGERGEGLVVV